MRLLVSPHRHKLRPKREDVGRLSDRIQREPKRIRIAELTPDRSHVFLRDGDRWRVFSTRDAQPEVTLSYEPGARGPVIVGPRAYYRAPGALVARELATDAVAWRLPLAEKPPGAAPRLRQ